MGELTEQQAKEVFEAMRFEDLLLLAESEGKPTSGLSKEQIINLLLGKCASCKGDKGNIVLTVIPLRAKAKAKIIKEEPCKTCGQK